MRKKNLSITTKFIPLILVSIIFLIGNNSRNEAEGFAIYLLEEDIPTAQPILSNVKLEQTPFISVKEIKTYNALTHELTLTSNAFNLILDLEVSVYGKPFIVCVDKKPIYCGAFWTPISSISFDGVTICKPLDSQKSDTIKLELGYPSSNFYGGEDPRENEDILKSLQKAGKLIGILCT